VIALARIDNEFLLQVFFVRGGQLQGREHYMMQAASDASDPEILAAFVKQFYAEATFIPREIVMAKLPAEHGEIQMWLASLTGRAVALTVPQKGEKHAMLRVAQMNADITMAQQGGQLRKEAEIKSKQQVPSRQPAPNHHTDKKTYTAQPLNNS
jgi:excinuclease ABC subunit C